MQRAARMTLLMAALCAGASHARAHVPLPRGLAIEPGDAGGIAVRMPGFGWLLRAPGASDGAFAYACDALLDVSPLEEQVPMVYRSDGTLIAGTAHGIRFLTGDGCPIETTPLLEHAISALALRPNADGPDLVYAISAGADAAPIVQRSDDGGEHWTARATLDQRPVSALVLDPRDPDTLYVSQAMSTDAAAEGASEGASIAVSSDGGATFATVAQQRALTLLHVQDEPARIWARARVATSGVGVDILRAERVQGPWQVVLSVNFFGGFAVDPNDADVIWVGDEARGVYRSSDGGDSFDKSQPDIAASCLAYGDGALWACTPGLPQRTALARSPDALAAFAPIMAFADVQQLVACSPQANVVDRCAAAWVEWQRDVLMTLPAEQAPAMGAPDAGAHEMTRAPDAAAAPEEVRSPDQAAQASGCTVRMQQRATSGAACVWCACVLLAFVLGASRWGSRQRRALDTAPWFCDGARSFRMQSDLELMQRAASGDPDAFAAIYDRHAATLLALARRMLRRSDDARDLLHDVFLEAWQHVREYDPTRATPRTWLIVRLRSRALDRRAHAARGTRVAQTLDALPELAPASTAHSEARADERREITRSLAELDCDLRRVLELTYYEGLTALEISERDGTPVGTVRSRLARGLDQLRALLAQVTEQGDG